MYLKYILFLFLCNNGSISKLKYSTLKRKDFYLKKILNNDCLYLPH